MTRGPRSVALGVVVAAACAGPEPEATPRASSEEGPALVAPALAATADPFARGLDHDDFPRVRQVAPDVYTYEQLRSAGEEWFTTVSLFVVGSEGVLVADGQGSEEETRLLLDHVAAVTPLPVTHLVVASDHGDHTGGNAAFPDGLRVFAHPTSAAALEAAGAPGPAPTDLVPDRAEIDLGGRTVEVRFLGRAHTGGDLVVHVPDGKVLFLSEAYLHRVFPAMRTAYPSEWVAMIERAQAMEADVYVPGHGFVDPPEVLERELEVFRRAVVAVIDEARRLHAAGVPLERAMAEARFGDLETWSLRSSQGPRAVQQVYAELDGRLP